MKTKYYVCHSNGLIECETNLSKAVSYARVLTKDRPSKGSIIITDLQGIIVKVIENGKIVQG